MIRVVLVDDSPSVRAVLRRFFAKTPDIQVVGEAEDGAPARRAVVDVQPPVVGMAPALEAGGPRAGPQPGQPAGEVLADARCA